MSDCCMWKATALVLHRELEHIGNLAREGVKYMDGAEERGEQLERIKARSWKMVAALESIMANAYEIGAEE